MNQTKSFQKIEKAVAILRGGGLVAFPTETVYGLGARVFDAKAVACIYKVKKRPVDNPLIIHIGRKEDLSRVVKNVPPIAKKLIEKFWPGPLTLILPRSPKVPKIATGGLDTVAVRMPKHPIALKLLRTLREPIAAPSANLSGRPSPTRAEHARQELGNAVNLILDGGFTKTGLESTILDVITLPPTLLRPGVITREMLEKIVGPVRQITLEEEKSVSVSPGIRHRHYAPRCKVTLVDPSHWRNGFLKEISGKKVGILCRSLGKKPTANVIYFRKIKGGLSSYARELFSSMREAEAAGIKTLFIETVPLKGMGQAIMDRLTRASQAR